MWGWTQTGNSGLKTGASPRRVWQAAAVGWIVSVVSVAAAGFVTHWLRKVFQPDPTALFSSALFFCAIIFSSWFGGLGPGILASFLSILTIKYYFSPPLHTFTISINDLPRLVMFLGTGVFISWLSGRQKRSEEALRLARDELEQRVNERTEELTSANQELRTEIAERKRTETLLDGQKRVLEMIAANAPLSESLAALMRLSDSVIYFPGRPFFCSASSQAITSPSRSSPTWTNGSIKGMPPSSIGFTGRPSFVSSCRRAV